MKHVVFYTSAEDVLSKAPPHYPAHKARLDEFHARGDLLMVGTFADPQKDGSMAIFASRDAAEAFVAGDPFVLEGVVSAVEIRGWNEVLAG
ncbi:MAG TPA: YciI family protein [Baekduia sp.]|nr:YciI family protein [Baekduia sp.]